MQTSTIFAILASVAAVAALPQAADGAPNRPAGQMLTVCSDENLQGTCIGYSTNDLEVCKNLVDQGMNDVVSSLNVNAFMQCTLFTDNNCSGADKKFTGRTNSLTENNDSFSSLRCSGL